MKKLLLILLTAFVGTSSLIAGCSGGSCSRARKVQTTAVTARAVARKHVPVRAACNRSNRSCVQRSKCGGRTTQRRACTVRAVRGCCKR